MAFVKAKREQVWLKVLLTGASGAGKSFSALRLATGIAKKCNSDIAFISTEGTRTNYYADSFAYDVLELKPPYSPDNYIKAIEEAVSAGYKVLIIDSMSHEWQYLLDTHERMPGNSFTNWGKLKPKHRLFMEKILHSPIHIVCCARSKTEWTLEDKNGKQVPKKVGLGTEQDKQIAYEYTLSLVIDQESHIASVDKDNTRLFDGKYEILTETHGEALYDWANTGEKPVTTPTTSQPTEADLDTIKSEIISKATTLMKSNKDEVIEALKIAPDSNPNKLSDVETATKLLEALNDIN